MTTERNGHAVPLWFHSGKQLRCAASSKLASLSRVLIHSGLERVFELQAAFRPDDGFICSQDRHRPSQVARNPGPSSNQVMCTKSLSTATLMKSLPRLDMLRRRETPGDIAVLTLYGALNVLPPSREIAE